MLAIDDETDRTCCTDGLSDAAEDYLKTLYKLTSEEGNATVSALAERLEVSAPSVSAMLKRLERDRLVTRGSDRGVGLTAHGRDHALRVVRRHRLLETFLVRTLGLSWDEVHAEAEVLEHAVSEQLEARIAAALGDPSVDPHGDPIPPAEGPHDESWHEPLEAAPPRSAFRVERVSDRDSEALRHLAALGIRPGVTLQVLRHDPFGGPLWVEVAGEPTPLGTGLVGLVHGRVVVDRSASQGAGSAGRLADDAGAP